MTRLTANEVARLRRILNLDEDRRTLLIETMAADDRIHLDKELLEGMENDALEGLAASFGVLATNVVQQVPAPPPVVLAEPDDV